MSSIMRRRRGLTSVIEGSCLLRGNGTIHTAQIGTSSHESRRQAVSKFTHRPLPRSGFVQYLRVQRGPVAASARHSGQQDVVEAGLNEAAVSQEVYGR